MPGDRLPPPPRAGQRRRRRRARAGRRRRSTTSTSSPSTQGPGLVGALLVGVATAKALAAARRPAARAGRPPPGPRRGELPARRTRSSRRSCACRQRRPHVPGARRGPRAASRSSARRSTTPRARRSTRARGMLGLPFPGGPHARALARGRRPARRSPSRSRGGVAGPRLLLRRPEDRAALQASAISARRGAEPPRRPRRLLPARDRRGARAARRAGARADRPRPAGDRRRRRRQPARCASALAELGADRCTCPPLALCTDNAAMIACAARFVDAASPPATTSALDAYATGQRGLARARRRHALRRAPGCHLCDEARARAASGVRADVRVRLVEIDIESDDALFKPLPGAHPGHRARRRGAATTSSSTSRTLRPAARVAQRMSVGDRTPAVERRQRRPSASRSASPRASSRYLQVLTQAKKRARRRSPRRSSPTGRTSTRRRSAATCRGFGKFGKRGVGYNVDSLVSQIRKILRTAGQHNIALFGAGHLGKAIASSRHLRRPRLPRRRDLRRRPEKIGEKVGTRRSARSTTWTDRRGRGHRRRRPRGARRPRPSRSPTSSSTPA